MQAEFIWKCAKKIPDNLLDRATIIIVDRREIQGND